MANALSQEPYLENDNLPAGIKLSDNDLTLYFIEEIEVL